jgi:hypothetical protein
LAESLYLIVAHANYQIENISGMTAQLNKRARLRQFRYEDNIDRVNRLSDDLETSRTEYTDRKGVFDGKKDTDRRVNIFNSVTTALFILVLLACISAVVFPFEQRTKLTICVWIISITIISSLILYFSYNRAVTEAFYSSARESLSSFSRTGSSLGSWDDEVELINTATIVQAEKYLQNIIYTANIMNTYKTYGNANTSLSRELQFFYGMRDNIDNQAAKTKQAGNIVQLSSIEKMYRIYLLISLMIIVSLAFTGYIGVEDNVNMQNKIIYFAVFLSIMAFVFYIISINRRVRTETRHYYWKDPGNPDKYVANIKQISSN